MDNYRYGGMLAVEQFKQFQGRQVRGYIRIKDKHLERPLTRQQLQKFPPLAGQDYLIPLAGKLPLQVLSDMAIAIRQENFAFWVHRINQCS